MIRIRFRLRLADPYFQLAAPDGRECEILELAARRIRPSPDPQLEAESAARFTAMMASRKADDASR